MSERKVLNVSSGGSGIPPGCSGGLRALRFVLGALLVAREALRAEKGLGAPRAVLWEPLGDSVPTACASLPRPCRNITRRTSILRRSQSSNSRRTVSMWCGSWPRSTCGKRRRGAEGSGCRGEELVWALFCFLALPGSCWQQRLEVTRAGRKGRKQREETL